MTWAIVLVMIGNALGWLIDGGNARRWEYLVAVAGWLVVGIPVWLSFLVYAVIYRRNLSFGERRRAIAVATLLACFTAGYILIEWNRVRAA